MSRGFRVSTTYLRMPPFPLYQEPIIQTPRPEKKKKTPPPTRRQGPRPLALHLAAPMFAQMSSKSVSLTSKNDWVPWRKNLAPAVEALRKNLAGIDPEAFRKAVDTVALRQQSDTLAGVLRYRHHAYQRTLPAPPVVWQSGAVRLFDYGTQATAKKNGVPVLFVPSLINRSYVLDLSERASMIRYLAGHGVRPFLLDWGTPGEIERRFTLADYITGPLEGAFHAAQSLAGARVAIAGYCMGGLLALALADRQRQSVPGLALLATPWDFHAGEDGKNQGQAAKVLFESLAPLVDGLGEMPADILQSLFFLLSPFQAARKFRAFASLDPNSARARNFMALEDWINDGTALAAPVARECFLDWYGANLPARGEWKIAGRKLRPENFDRPAFLCIPSQDYIVPPASARALAEALPQAETRILASGHIGMAVSAQARDTLWRPLAEWLRNLV